MYLNYIGVGASPAGPVLAGPLFRQYNEIHYNIFKNYGHTSRTLTTAGQLQKFFLCSSSEI